MTRNQNGTARRRFVQLLGAGAVIGAGSAAVAADDDATEADSNTQTDDSGLVTLESDADFETTLARVEPALEARDLMLVTTVDHAENAASVDEELPPTTLFLFGNPEVGTPLMRASRSVAIDLPQKLLVWEVDGAVFVTYNDPQYLARHHGLEGVDEQLAGIADALEDLAIAVAHGE
ncbi:DUF302 domain-containing protein [Natronorubrum sp. DTA28]|uniref:DUF302 domain-containing protein n=1 Tax=Natronorubrum sp. DTA28 TaxID=3447019 RepID=UPI003F87BC56